MLCGSEIYVRYHSRLCSCHIVPLILVMPAQCHVMSLLLQYVIPYLLGFDEIFQFDGGADAGPSDGLGADWARPAIDDAAPAAMPTSAPF